MCDISAKAWNAHERHYWFVCLGLSSALQENRDRQTRFLVRSPASNWCQNWSLSNLPSGKPIPTRQWRIPLFVLRYSSVDYIFDSQNWDGLCECMCVFKKRLALNSQIFFKIFPMFSLQAKKRQKAWNFILCTHTQPPWIKSMSLKSRRVLRLLPLDWLTKMGERCWMCLW